MTGTWQLIRSETILSNRWLRITKNNYEVGSNIIDDYFIISRSPFVLIVAEMADGVVLVRQYRPATKRFYWSLPAGFINEGENIIDAGKRELLEETGIVASDLMRVGSLDPLPGYISSTGHVLTCIVSEGSTIRVADNEINQISIYSWDDIISMIVASEINEMQAVAALLLAYQTKKRAT